MTGADDQFQDDLTSRLQLVRTASLEVDDSGVICSWYKARLVGGSPSQQWITKQNKYIFMIHFVTKKS